MENSLAIIILNYCNYKLTEECINNLIKLNVQSRIIVVDNNSKNGSYEYLSKALFNYENVDVIENNINAGYSAGNNFGIRYAFKKYENIRYIAIMNPDVIITYKEILSNIINKLDSKDDIAAAGALMVYKNEVDFEGSYWNIPTKLEVVFENCNWTRLMFNKRNHKRIGAISDWNGNAKVGVLPGSFFIIKADVLKEIGLFDEGTFLYNEENILAIRLREKGYGEMLSTTDFYIHNHNPSIITKKTLKKYYNLVKVNYQSRKYLCDTYYRNKLVSFTLTCVQVINYFDMTVRFFGGFIKRKLKSR